MTERLKSVWPIIRNDVLGVVGVAIVLGVLLLIPLAPVIAPYGPEEVAYGDILVPPLHSHPFGTDFNGMDVFSRVVYAPRIDIAIAASATTLAMLVGIPLGALAGYFGDRRGLFGFLSELTMRTMDVFQAFPVFILAMALVAAAGLRVSNVIAAIAFVNMPVFVRLVRSEMLVIRQLTFAEAALCSGNSDWRIVFRHMMPNAVGSALVQMSVTTGWSILLTSGLSFVGAGVRVPTAEWGSMISIGAKNMITGEWWTSLFPGLALGLTVFGFAAFGDALGRWLDPAKRQMIVGVYGTT